MAHGISQVRAYDQPLWPIHAPVVTPDPSVRSRWESGGVQVEGLLYRATTDNVFTEDLSLPLLRWTVVWNADKGAGEKLSLKLQLDSRILLTAYRDWVAPVLRLTWADGVVEEQQFGLFMLDMEDATIYADFAIAEYDGFDPTRRLQNSVVLDTYNVAAATNAATAITNAITPVWPRVVVPQTARTIASAISWFPFSGRYDIAAKIAEASGWYYPYPDLVGQIHSRPYVDLATESPVMELDEADFQGTLRVVPTVTQLANIVVVTKPGLADADPIQSIQINDDPTDPISTVNREPLVKRITNNDIQTQGEADAIAREEVRSARSFYQVVSGELPPGVWMRPYQVVSLNAEHTAWGNLSGRYHLRVFEVGSQPSDNVKVEMNRWVEVTSG